MDEQELFENVKTALSEFFKIDHELLRLNASERSMAHKLAEHLKKKFPQHNVDCEYNRHGTSVKVLTYRIYNRQRVPVQVQRRVFPDVVVHQREVDTDNLVVIEIKKLSKNMDSSVDYAKLTAFTEGDFHYSVGLFLGFDMKNQGLGTIACFKEGREVGNTIWDNLKGLVHEH